MVSDALKAVEVSFVAFANVIAGYQNVVELMTLEFVADKVNFVMESVDSKDLAIQSLEHFELFVKQSIRELAIAVAAVDSDCTNSLAVVVVPAHFCFPSVDFVAVAGHLVAVAFHVLGYYFVAIEYVAAAVGGFVVADVVELVQSPFDFYLHSFSYLDHSTFVPLDYLMSQLCFEHSLAKLELGFVANLHRSFVLVVAVNLELMTRSLLEPFVNALVVAVGC